MKKYTILIALLIGVSCSIIFLWIQEKLNNNTNTSFSNTNVLLITIDTLRADHIGAYGYSEKITPNIDSLAQEGIVAVSTGLLRRMRRDQVEGVLAHEVSHIANGDMVTMTLIQGVVNAFVMFFARIIANIARNAVDEKVSYLVGMVTTIVLDIAFGVLGMMIVAWFSRAREFRADAGAGTLAGKGKMVAALQRLQQNTQMVDTSTPSLATMKIAGARGMMALLSTHPPLEDRIAALKQARRVPSAGWRVLSAVVSGGC